MHGFKREADDAVCAPVAAGSQSRSHDDATCSEQIAKTGR
jgi:hypothetical protein